MKRRLLLGCGGALAILGILLGGLLYLVFHRVEGTYFDSNGVRIHYTVEGQGEPVILVHGLAANADLNWRRPGVIRALSPHFQVIAMDCRGHGLSGKPTSSDMYGKEMMDDVLRLMDRLGIEKAHIAGYSMGGFIVLPLLASHPERFRSAAICAAGWRKPEDKTPFLRPYKPPPTAAARELRMASALPLLPTPAYAFLKRIQSYFGDKLNNRGALKACRKSIGATLVTEEKLRENKVPALCIIGTRDGLLPYAENLHQVMADLEYIAIDGANHFTAPFYGEFKRSLRDFFLRHRASRETVGG